MLYKYQASTLFLEYFHHCDNKIRNFGGGNNQFEKYFRQKLEKYFIDIIILSRSTKPFQIFLDKVLDKFLDKIPFYR